MKTMVTLLLSGLLLFAWTSPLPAEGTSNIRIRLYQGFRNSESRSLRIISTYFFQSQAGHYYLLNQNIDAEKSSLSRIFNLTGLDLITEGRLKLTKIENTQPDQVVILNHASFYLRAGFASDDPDLLSIQIREERNQDPPLAESELVIPDGKTAILGFEDQRGHTYFLSIYRFLDSGEETQERARLVFHQGPDLIYRVNPIYPRDAIQAGQEGMVILKGTVDTSGKVNRISIVTSAHPSLAEAALRAIRLWRYETRSGKQSRPLPFTITVTFILADKKAMPDTRVTFQLEANRLRIIERFEPVYPPTAARQKLSGEVTIGVWIDRLGRVAEMEVLDGPPILAGAAVDALKKWRFEPFVKGGKRHQVFIKIIFTFSVLDKTEPEDE